MIIKQSNPFLFLVKHCTALMNRTYKDANHCNTNLKLDKEINKHSGDFDNSHHSVLYQKFRSQILKSSCFENIQKILVGLSAGVDSAVLLHLLSRYQKENPSLEIIALHINHQQRGDESDADQRLAQEIAASCKVPFHAVVLDGAKKGMSEDELRSLRFSAFETFSRQHKIERTVLAHHMDDQVETFLFRLIRGADTKGLSAMKVFQSPLVRPLLYFRRDELLEEAEMYNVLYSHDSSNFFTGPSRNFVRKILLPAIQAKLDPQVVDHIFNTALSMTEIDSYMQDQASEMIGKVKVKDDVYSVSEMRQIPSIVRKKMIQLMFTYIIKDSGSLSRDHVEMIDQWMDTTQSPKYLILPKGIRVEKNQGVLRFSHT